MKFKIYFLLLNFIFCLSSLHAFDKSKKLDLTISYKKEPKFEKYNEVLFKKSHLDLNPHKNYPKDPAFGDLHHAIPKKGDRTVGEYWDGHPVPPVRPKK